MFSSATLMSLGLSVAACGVSNTKVATSTPPEGISKVQAIEGPVSFPESGVWDEEAQVWYVSSFGQAFDPTGGTADKSGFISRLDARGRVLDARLVEGAGDFLGLAMMNGKLYASHGADIWEIDPSTGKHDVITVPGAGFLNDIAVGEGALYITDTGAGAVHRYVPGKTPTVFSKDPALKAPNGIAVDNGQVVVVTLGAFPPNPATPGSVLALDDSGKATRLGKVSGLFDGVEVINGSYVVSDITGPLLRVDPNGDTRQLGDLKTLGLGSANDFGVDPNTMTLMMGDLTSNKVWQVSLF
ncbi:MAG: SMP-30/gluconolactonase/LRE family protein [Bradymonadia bacterium]